MHSSSRLLPGDMTDRPIERFADDLLDRGPFVDALAKALCGRKTDESIVVGVCGPWGSGKTSLKNLVIERLGQSDAPVLIRFEPWLLSGTEQIISDLFHSLLDALEPAGRIRPGFRAMFSKALALGASAGKAGALVAAAQGFAEIAVTVQTVSATLDSAKASVDAVASDETIYGLKAELDKTFRDDPRRFLVVVDEIDRLHPVEIQRFFQAIKATLALPRVDYLLFFQRQSVEAALASSGVADGRAYLEKLVPVVLDVPQVATSTLADLLTVSVPISFAGRVTSGSGYDVRIEQASELLCEHYVSSLRSLKRLLSAFEFHLGVHTSDGHLEVDPVDLLLLEAVRLFDPDVYQTLYAGRNLLTSAPNPREPYSRTERQETPRSRIDSRILRDTRHPETTSQVLSTVFPAVSGALGIPSSRDEATEVKELRACVPEYFDRYFRLRTGAEDFPLASLRRILEHADATRDIVEELKKTRPGSPRKFVMHRLRHSLSDLPPAGRPLLLAALFDFFEEIPGISFSWAHRHFEFSGGAALAIEVVRLEDPAERGALLRVALSRTTAFTLGTLLVERESDLKEAERVLAPSDRQALQAEVQARLLTASTKDSFLSDGPRLLHFLAWWKAFGDQDALFKWLDGLDLAQFEQLARCALEGWPETLGHRGPDGIPRSRNILDALGSILGYEALSAKTAALYATNPESEVVEAIVVQERSRSNPVIAQSLD